MTDKKIPVANRPRDFDVVAAMIFSFSYFSGLVYIKILKQIIRNAFYGDVFYTSANAVKYTCGAENERK